MKKICVNILLFMGLLLPLKSMGALSPSQVRPDSISTVRGKDEIKSTSTEEKITIKNFKDKAVEKVDSLVSKSDPWFRRQTTFGRSFAFIGLMVTTIIVCILTMIALLILILLNRTRMANEESQRQYLLEKYQTLIVDYLFGSTLPEEFSKIASNNFRRQILIDQMIDVSVNLKGDTSEKLINLYRDLGLDDYSLSKAHSRRWHIKIKAFRELAFMNVKEAHDIISESLNSKNEILRMEAQIALVRLSEEDPLSFLSNLKRPFSLWEQITLHEVLVQHNLPIPSFKRWLCSKNDTVVMFSLRMIKEYKQLDACELVSKTMSHVDADVRKLVVEVAGDLQMNTTVNKMEEMYYGQESDIRLAILKSFGKMADISMLEFLKTALDREEDVQLQIEATKAIENIGEEGIKTLVKMMKSEYKNYNIIVRHVLDRRIY